MKFKSEYYNETEITSINFSYGFKNGKIKNKDNFSVDIPLQNYKSIDLPISMNPIDYGRLIIKTKIESGVSYIIQNNKDQTINFKQFDNYNEIEFFKSGISLVKFIDTFMNNSKFMRKLDNKTYYFENNKQILSTSELKTKFIPKLNKSKTLTNNFLTLDIETYIKDSVLIPYAISIYDGIKTQTFYISDYKNYEDMILNALSSIMIRKYNGYKVYIHNMAKFDIIFLLKYLVKLAEVDPIIHNGRIISINLNYGKDYQYQIQFKDSYLLLLASLSKLSKAFKIDTPKSIFPYLFVNEDNFNYIGPIPDFKYFGGKISSIDYNCYIENYNI